VGGEAPVTPVSTLDSSFLTFPTNRAITVLDVVYTCHDIFDLRSLEGVPFCFAGPCLVASFGRTSLAWASMGQEAHRLDA
jgi:hypothetical protein